MTTPGLRYKQNRFQQLRGFCYTAASGSITFKKHGLAYQVVMEVGGWEAIKKYVELGLGISLIISIGITGQEKLEVIPAGEFFPKRTYGVVLRKGRILTPQARRFVNLLLSSKEAAPEAVSRGNGQTQA